MAFTDHSDLFGAVHEEAINFIVRHIMRQRPSLFNYATAFFHQRPDLFCVRIEAAKSVTDAGNPLFTEQAPLPVMGSPFPIGLNFCVQLTDFQIDFHPGNVFQLPPQLGTLGPQQYALRLRACVGLDCPPAALLDQLVPALESFVVAEQLLAVGETEEDQRKERSRLGAAASRMMAAAGARPGESSASRAMLAVSPVRVSGEIDRVKLPPRDILVLPTRELLCFCLELFAVGYFEWGLVQGSDQQWLKPRLRGLEIVDLQPNTMENMIECYLITLLRLGVLPRMIVPMEKMVLDITKELREKGIELGKEVKLMPSAVPGDVPNNPAIEDDQIKAFIKLTVEEGG
jgi:hypothetical protein